jgi:hypothetical protein
MIGWVPIADSMGSRILFDAFPADWRVVLDAISAWSEESRTWSIISTV